MLILIRSTLISLLLTSMASCRFSEGASDVRIALPASAKPVPNADSLFTDRFRTHDRIVFRSFNGRWVGTDCDAEIRLFPDRKAILTAYGVGVTHYDADYSYGPIQDNQSATVQFTFTGQAVDDSPLEFPKLQLYVDGSELILVPAEGTNGYVRVDDPIDPRNLEGLNWTFRQVEIPAIDAGGITNKNLTSRRAVGP